MEWQLISWLNHNLLDKFSQLCSHSGNIKAHWEENNCLMLRISRACVSPRWNVFCWRNENTGNSHFYVKTSFAVLVEYNWTSYYIKDSPFWLEFCNRYRYYQLCCELCVQNITVILATNQKTQSSKFNVIVINHSFCWWKLYLGICWIDID